VRSMKKNVVAAAFANTRRCKDCGGKGASVSTSAGGALAKTMAAAVSASTSRRGASAKAAAATASVDNSA